MLDCTGADTGKSFPESNCMIVPSYSNMLMNHWTKLLEQDIKIPVQRITLMIERSGGGAMNVNYGFKNSRDGEGNCTRSYRIEVGIMILLYGSTEVDTKCSRNALIQQLAEHSHESAYRC